MSGPPEHPGNALGVDRLQGSPRADGGANGSRATSPRRAQAGWPPARASRRGWPRSRVRRRRADRGHRAARRARLRGRPVSSRRCRGGHCGATPRWAVAVAGRRAGATPRSAPSPRSGGTSPARARSSSPRPPTATSTISSAAPRTPRSRCATRSSRWRLTWPFRPSLADGRKGEVARANSAYEDACVLFNSMISTRPRYVARCATRRRRRRGARVRGGEQGSRSPSAPAGTPSPVARCATTS